MFNLFRARCPLDTREKAWVELRMRWLAEQFGLERMLCATVLEPTSPLLSEQPYSPTPDCAGHLLDKLARHMGLDPASLRFSIRPDEEMPEASGLYHRLPRKRSVIRIAESLLDDPPALVATLAHELSHELLLGRGRLQPDEPDHELLTDLLPVYLGLGIFAANVAVRQYSTPVVGGNEFGIRQHGYLPARVFGYGMALCAYVRGEKRPAWSRHLEVDARHALRQGLRYLHRTGDTYFDRDAGGPRSTLTPTDAIRDLAHGSPSRRVIVLGDLLELKGETPELQAAVMKLIGDRDVYVAVAAVLTAVTFAHRSAELVNALLKALTRSDPELRVAALMGLGDLRPQDGRVIPALIEMLLADQAEVVEAAALALRGYGASAADAVPYLMRALKTARVDCDDQRTECVAGTLLQVSPDAEQRLTEAFADDPPFLLQLLEALHIAGVQPPMPSRVLVSGPEDPSADRAVG